MSLRESPTKEPNKRAYSSLCCLNMSLTLINLKPLTPHVEERDV